MKRIVSIIALLTLVCLLATSCGGTTENTVYDKLNNLAENGVYNYLAVTVTTVIDEQTELENTYTYQQVGDELHVEFTIQSLAEYEEGSDGWIAPDDIIETVSGSAVIKDGEVVSFSGNSEAQDFSCVSFPSFNFKAAYFSSVVDEDGHFAANVVSPGAFLGTYSPCSAMSIDVNYHQFTITEMVITYTSPERHQVTAKYEYK